MPVALIFVCLLVAAAPAAAEQQVVDRVIARVEDDVLTLSELRELRRFQQLVDGRAQDDSALFQRLVEQWVVATEAEAARFPRPADAEADAEMHRLAEQLGGEEAWQARLREVGLTEAAVRRMVERQLYLERYLDYKFRPAAMVEPERVEAYYREELGPRLEAEGQAVPPLEDVRERIRELLVQREITRRANGWLDQARARLRVEILAEELRP